MGTFTASNHVLNKELLTKAQFKKAFVGAMKSQGYTTASEDDAALTFTLVFSPDRKWVTVLSDEYQPGGQETRRDASLFAKSLSTEVVSVSLVDSDFAELELYDSSGRHSDTMTLGDSYLGDEAPTGSQEPWQPLLNDGGTWEQVTAIQSGSYTFAEDALSEFAPLIGMDSRNILLDSEDISDEDNAQVLYFKKAGEKKLTLNAAFKQVFGEALEPLGFIKAKTKYPYYIRLVDNSFVQIIGLEKRSENVFNIIAGVATIYRTEINLNCSQRMNINWMRGVYDFYESAHEYDFDWDYRQSILCFGFNKFENEYIIKAFERSLEVTEKWVLTVFNKMTKLSDVIDYLYTYFMSGLDIYGPDISYWKSADEQDAFLCFDLEDPYEIVEKRRKNACKDAQYRTEHNIDGLTKNDYEDYCNGINHNCEKIKEYISKIINDKDLYDETMAEIRQRKMKNIEILKSYGLKFDE